MFTPVAILTAIALGQSTQQSVITGTCSSFQAFPGLLTNQCGDVVDTITFDAHRDPRHVAVPTAMTTQRNHFVTDWLGVNGRGSAIIAEQYRDIEAPPCVNALDMTEVPLGGLCTDILAADVNGDGLTDVLWPEPTVWFQGDTLETRLHTLLSRADGYDLVVHVLPGELRTLGDLDADGYDDVLSFLPLYGEPSQGALFDPPYARTIGSHLRVFRGGPSGFDTEPLWELDDLPRFAGAAAANLDADPQLETWVVHSDGSIHLVDITPNGVDLALVGQPWPWPGTSLLPHVINVVALDDWDGDGIPDLFHTNFLLSAANGYDPEKPIQAFTIGKGPTGLSVADLDLDGALDIAVTYNQSGPGNITIHWGPTEPLPHTGHTGTTTHTGTPDPDTTADTAQGSASEDTASTSSARGACGCAQPTPPSALLGIVLLCACRRRPPALS